MVELYRREKKFKKNLKKKKRRSPGKDSRSSGPGLVDSKSR